MSAGTLPIHFLGPGDSGSVVSMHGEDSIITQLAEKGLKVGSKVSLLSSGKSSVLKVDETKLSLRLDNLVDIMVQMEP